MENRPYIPSKVERNNDLKYAQAYYRQLDKQGPK